MNSGIWVFKVGGSLHANAQLRSWLAALASYGAGKAVIVPGGGPFADAVRAAQARWRFPDVDAHFMALQAMDQYGRMLSAIEPRLVHARGEPQLRAMLEGGQTVICPAVGMFAEDPSIAPGWGVTSDSLAAILAAAIGATGLALVKSAIPTPGRHDAQVLADRGIVDAAFPGYLAAVRFRSWWLAASMPEAVVELLAGRFNGAEIVGRAMTIPPAADAADQRGG
jgi:aspartokinase-like uncharacterized kinase